MAGQAQKVGTEINASAVRASFWWAKPRAFKIAASVWVAQMGARGGNAAGISDQFRIDINFAQSDIGAVFAVKDQRKLFLVANAQQHQSGQAFGVSQNAARCPW